MTRKRTNATNEDVVQEVSKVAQVEVAGNLSVTHPDNREAVTKFGIISSLLVIAPLILYALSDRYEWSIEKWGFITVVVMNLIMGCYAYLVYREESLEQTSYN